jgi:hypothetical protein
MSRIGDRSHAERLTREAAEAIGVIVPEGARWDALLGGLQLAPTTPYSKNTFAPLNDFADAYHIETTLQLSVQYMANGGGTILQMSHKDKTGSMFEVLRDNDPYYNARKRMELAVIMASLHLMINGAQRRRESDHGLEG